MSDSSDDDDLEALRQEALKSLKSKNQANPALSSSCVTTERTDRNSSQISKNDHPAVKTSLEQSSPYRNRSPEHAGRGEKSVLDRVRSKYDPRNQSDHRQDPHSSEKFTNDPRRSRGQNRFSREPFSKPNTNSKYDSDHRNPKRFDRNYNYPRRRTNSNERRRKTQLRRSHSPEHLHSNRNPRSVSPSNHRKFPHRSSRRNDKQISHEASEYQDGKSPDPLTSLPLCSPKHYVELFYGKKLSSNNVTDPGVSNLDINDEDRALLSEKSQSERDPVLSCPEEMITDSENPGKSNREAEFPLKPPSFRNEIVSHQVERIKRTLRSGPPLRTEERTRDGRLSSSGSRTLTNDRKSKRTKLNHESPLSKGRLGARVLEKNIDEGNSSQPDMETERPIDPVLEARRKKFECNDVVKVVPKKIKLSNMSSKPDLIPNDESDLRNLLIAKHREKSISTALYLEEKTSVLQNLYNSGAVSPPNMHPDLSSLEETITPTEEPPPVSCHKPVDFPSTHKNDEAVESKGSEEVRVKVEIETEFSESLDLNPTDSSNMNMNLNLDQPPAPHISESLPNASNYPTCDFSSETENIPVFESADYAAAKAIKKEPTFAEIEENFKPPAEKPIIDEPELIPQQPDKPEVSIPAGPVLKIKPLTELLDKKVLKKVKKRKKEEKRSAKKKKKRAKSKERDRESYAVKLSKRATKVSSQKVTRKASFPTRIVRSALEEALGKKKRKVFNEGEDVPSTNLELHSSKDHRKVLILDESPIDEPNEDFSPPIQAAAETESGEEKLLEEIEEDLDNDTLTFRLSSKTPLYNSKKAKKTPDIYKMIQLNQM
nr:PREDICTED: uncharacterized protein LOC109037339 [Bemisia tabaci]